MSYLQVQRTVLGIGHRKAVQVLFLLHAIPTRNSVYFHTVRPEDNVYLKYI
jgi:hypothetical protein